MAATEGRASAAGGDLVERVLTFWFGPRAGPGFGEKRAAWFKAGLAFDREIAKRFAAEAEAAAAGRLHHLAATAEGALALVILLDQFPRNIHRGTPRAFAADRHAREVAAAALARGFDRELAPTQRLFLYLPFEHGEELADQERAVALVAALGDAEALDYAIRHRDIIARFGRFPHRNAILGRASTAKEAAFLKQPGSSF
ncbi:MAG: DUF924 domain-containing protein [Proteobacteria bacterium]|nr:DUF924 domain-containing protein [Pseudomonadota bacterium]